MLHIKVHLEHAWNQSKGHSGSRCDHQGIVLVQERPLASLGRSGNSRRGDTNSSFSSFNPDRNIAATFQALPGATCRQRRGPGARLCSDHHLSGDEMAERLVRRHHLRGRILVFAPRQSPRRPTRSRPFANSLISAVRRNILPRQLTTPMKNFGVGSATGRCCAGCSRPMMAAPVASPSRFRLNIEVREMITWQRSNIQAADMLEAILCGIFCGELQSRCILARVHICKERTVMDENRKALSACRPDAGNRRRRGRPLSSDQRR
jgi:hypothetical protein